MIIDKPSHSLKAAAAPAFDAKNRPDPSSFNINKIVTDYLVHLRQILDKPNETNLKEILYSDGFWRDHLFLSWDLRTLRNVDKVAQFLSETVQSKKLASVRFSVPEDNYKRRPQLDASNPASIFITAFIDIESSEGFGEGLIKLYLDGDNKTWKAFTIYTALRDLKKYPQAIGANRPHGGRHGDQSVDPRNWKEQLEEHSDYKTSSPTVLIVGAGQAGLTVAARLVRLGISVLIVDKNPRIGDNWRNRYHSLVLHDPVWYDHLPYLPFPKSWPIFTPKDKLADWLDNYARIMEVPVWTSSTVVGSSEYKDGIWTVKVSKGGQEERVLKPKHVILATGHSGEPNIPDFKDVGKFKGQVLHSSKWTDPKRLKGKKVLIVGACNTAHDIAQSLLASGASPTIIQRSSTYVISSKHGLPQLLAPTYSENGPDIEEADLLAFGTPNAFLKTSHQEATTALRSPDKDGPIIAGLEKAGFKMDYGPDGAGLLMKYFERGGGYYINIGASEMIADGKIGIKNAGIDRFTENGIVFNDGSELEAAEVVLATGYQNMRTTAGLIFPTVKDSVKTVWGFDEEGELQTMYRDSGHPGFWFMGGNLAHCRFFSRYLAFKVLGKEVGLC